MGEVELLRRHSAARYLRRWIERCQAPMMTMNRSAAHQWRSSGARDEQEPRRIVAQKKESLPEAAMR
jgi:hypothetical protein